MLFREQDHALEFLVSHGFKVARPAFDADDVPFDVVRSPAVDVASVAPARFSGVVGGDRVRPVGMLSQEKCQKARPVGDVDDRIVQAPDGAPKSDPTCGSCGDLHKADRRVVDASFITALPGVEARLLGDDPCHEDGIDMVLT